MRDCTETAADGRRRIYYAIIDRNVLRHLLRRHIQVLKGTMFVLFRFLSADSLSVVDTAAVKAFFYILHVSRLLAGKERVLNHRIS